MKKYLFNAVLLSGAILASCSDDVLEKPVHEEYAKSFVELFGPIDPKQDWNMAEQKSVTVELGTAAEVSIYAKTDVAYNLVGKYSNVSGSQVLKFDAPETVNDFLVYANGQGKKAGNGEKVTFDGVKSRGAFVDNLTSYAVQHESVTEFPVADIAPFLTMLPECQSSNESLDGLKYDFFALAGNNRARVWPIYWNSGMDHELGIYFRTVDEDGNVRILDLENRGYAERNNDESGHYPIWRSHKYIGEEDRDAGDFYVRYSQKRIYTPFWGTIDYKKPSWDDAQEAYYSQNPYWEGEGTDPSLTLDNLAQTKLTHIYSKGFDINIEAGISYGFYLKVWHSWNGEDYSDRKQKVIWYTDKELNFDGYTHAAYFEFGNNMKYLCFEDFYGKNQSYADCGTFTSDRDFNDVVFIFDPAPEIVHNEGLSWILAVEDLGTTDDYDFNDAVIGVERIAGTTTAKITPLAAGGTLPIHLMHDGKVVSEELHSYWGKTDDGEGNYPMINTQSEGKPGESFEVEVGREFSLAEYTDEQMGGFNIQVNNVPNTTIIVPPHAGEAPQMICVPYNWSWPKERVRIDFAYPGFSKWSSDSDDQTSYEGAIWGDGYLGGGWLSPMVETNVIENTWAPAANNND